MMNILLIRADAYLELGTGHIMRCLALAQEWKQRYYSSIVFVTHVSTPPTLVERLQHEGCQVVFIASTRGSEQDARETIAFAIRYQAQWIIIDGYDFGYTYQQFIKSYGFQVVFIDDYGHANAYVADIILNQNLHAQESYYLNRTSQTALLLGSQYVLLRREFWPWRDWKRLVKQHSHRILLTLGGVDAPNVTRTVLAALSQMHHIPLEIVVIVGAANPHWKSLVTIAEESPHQVQLRRNVTSMPELLAWADLAIAAAGSTCWELLFMGLPSILIELADNQRPIAASLMQASAAISIGYHAELSQEKIIENCATLLKNQSLREQLSVNGKKLVDGWGASRVVQAIQNTTLRLRRASMNDVELLWHWANDPHTRNMSFSSMSIPWEEHQRWFTHKLQDPATHIYIAELGSTTPIGQIRLDLDQHVATISINLAPAYWGQGYGVLMVRQAITIISNTLNISRFRALIKPENLASVKMFEKAGFVKSADIYYRGQPAIELILTTNRDE